MTAPRSAPATWGACGHRARVGPQRRLFKLLAVGQGGVTAVEQVWLNDVVVARSGDAATTPPYDGKVSIRHRTGFGAEFSGGAYPTLSAAFSAWTADHRLDGIGTILGEFDAVKGEKIAEVYGGGDPAMTATSISSVSPAATMAAMAPASAQVPSG